MAQVAQIAWWKAFWQENIDVRPAERGRAGLGFLTLFGLVVTHELLETARHTVFLQTRTAAELPYAYLVLAGVAVVWSIAAKLLDKRVHHPALSTMLMLSSAGIALAWVGSAFSSGTIFPYFLYLASSLIVPVWMVAFWVKQSSLWTVLEAKRIFAFFALGGLAGNICGAALSAGLGDRYGARALLAAACVVSAATAWFGARKIERIPEPTTLATEEEEEAEVRDAPKSYVPLLLTIAVLAAIAMKLGEYLFLRGVSARVDEGSLARTLAMASMFSAIGAVVIQLLFARWALRAIGVTRSVAILPSLYAAVAAVSASGSSFYAPMVLRITDGALRQPVYRTAMELLFVPLPQRIRQSAKTWVDIAGQRAGQALASLAILGIAAWAAPHDYRLLAIATFGVALLWAIAAPLLHRDYVELFRVSLGRKNRAQPEAPTELEHQSVVALLASLQDKDATTVVAAIDLLVDSSAANILPASLLVRRDPAILIKALEVGPQGSRSWQKAARRLLAHEDPEVRAAALRFVGTVDAARGMLKDSDLLVRVTAFVIAFSHSDNHETQDVLQSFSERDPETQLALVAAVSAGGPPATQIEPVLLRLAREATHEVQVAIAQVAARYPIPRLLPALIEMVAHAQTRAAAREAISAYGASALHALREKLEDDATPPVLRRHLPGTIGRVGGKRAAHELLARYPGERDERVRSKLLRGLLWLRQHDKTLPLDDGLLALSIDRTLARGAQLGRWGQALYGFLESAPSYRTAASERLLEVLYEERTHSLEHSLALLELQHRGEDYATVRRNVVRGDEIRKAQAIELLGNIALAELRPRLFALTSEQPALTTVEITATPAGTIDAREYQSLLEDMVTHGSEAVTLLATRARDEHPAFALSLHGAALASGEAALAPAEAALCLRKVPLFEHVDPKGLALLVAEAQDRSYPPDAAVTGARTDQSLVVVVSGLLEGPDRAVFEAGATLNEAGVFSEDLAPLVVARSEVRTLEIRASALLDVMAEHFEVLLAVSKKLAADALGRPTNPRASRTDRVSLEVEGIIERMDLVRAAMPFLDAGASSTAQIASTASLVRRAEGEPIFGQSPACSTVTIVARGRVRSADGQNELGSGSVLGLLEAVAEVETPEYVATSPVELLTLPIDELFDVLEEHHGIQAAFLRFCATCTSPVRPASQDLAA